MMGPVTILLCVNLLCLVSSVRALARLRTLEQPATAKLQAKIAFFRFLPFVKLTVITGVSWVFEVVSFFTNGLAGMAYLELALDIVNMLQGPLIFTLFCCRRLVFIYLRDHTRLGPCFGACLGRWAKPGGLKPALECEVLRASQGPNEQGPPKTTREEKCLKSELDVGGANDGAMV